MSPNSFFYPVLGGETSRAPLCVCRARAVWEREVSDERHWPRARARRFDRLFPVRAFCSRTPRGPPPDTMRRTSGVIVYLAQGGRHSSYGRDSVKLLRSSVQRLVDNYLGTHKDDVLFFHFGDVPDNVQHELVALCGFDVNARFLMAPSNYTTVPPGTPPASKWVHAKKFSAGYRHMIRLYTIGIWPILAEEGCASTSSTEPCCAAEFISLTVSPMPRR